MSLYSYYFIFDYQLFYRRDPCLV